ncbi:MAG TPA: TonB-dependent receptor [Bacteroidales bacterium]|nr:TonB-dependent receptor [Bacteroidales bacterium]
MKTVKILILVLFPLFSVAQEFNVKGRVVDAQTSEKLGGVHVQLSIVEGAKSYFAITNLKGEFLIRGVAHGEYMFITSYLGYTKYEQLRQINSDTELDILIDKELVQLGEVVVSSTKSKQLLREVPLPLAIVGQKEIESASSFTISDILQKEPGIALGRDGVWATSVNIRGLSEQRIVMMVDGNRIETATDLNASMSFFDVGEIERVEVIKGAGSSLYGTGAMGGIVNVITREGYFNSARYFNGSFNAGYSSVNNLNTQKLSFNTGSERWYASVSGAMRNAGDVNTPQGEIANSQFKDKSISANAGFKITENQVFKLKYQYFDADDAGIPGGAPFTPAAVATYADAKRWMLSANYEIKDISESLKIFHIKYFHQYIVRNVELYPNISTPTAVSVTTPELFTPSGEHVTDGIQLQSNWNFNTNNNLIIGIDAWRRKLETSREKYIRVDLLNTEGDITATNNIVRGETPTPNSCFGSAGIYMQDEHLMFNDKLKIIIGGRLDGIRIANEQALDYDYLIVNGVRNDTPPNQRITFDESEEYKISWSANAGLLYKLTKDMDLSLNAGRSFRAPSLEESFKYIDLGSKVRLGDPNLDPEKGYSIDLGLRLWKPSFHFNISAYVNWLNDMIVEQDGEFIYSYVSGLVDTIPAAINTNVDKARLYGIDISFEYNPVKNWVLYGSGMYVRGEDTQNNTDLPLIPPMNGRIGLRYNWPGIISADIVAVGFADQDKVAAGESETKGYARFDFMLQSALIPIDFAKVQLTGGIENMGDRAYSNHLSTNRGAITIEPGRNFYVKLKVLF